jgi:hypothetical protein
MNALQEYSSSDEDGGSPSRAESSTRPDDPEKLAHLKPLDPEVEKYSQKSSLQVVAAPDVIPQVLIRNT